MTKTITLLLAAFCGLAVAGPVTVEGVRVASEPKGARLVLDVSGVPDYQLMPLENPQRLVVDLSQASLRQAVFEADIRGGPLKGVRSAPREGGGLRVVLDLERLAAHRAYVLPPDTGYGHRLVVELTPSAESSAKAGEAGAVVRKAESKAVAETIAPLRDLIIAIDAGHGGKDPGASGMRGTREKDIVLSMARRLASLVDAEPGMRAVLVRKGDYFIKLRDRIKIAREQQADLFISIHADSIRDFGASGSSVYILSRDGASSEAARWLAESENAADLAGGVKLDDKDQMVASVLLDMSQTKTIEESAQMAGNVLRQLAGVGDLHSRRVQQAGFAVLKSPDIPSLLVETGFISNPEEEKRLRDPVHQQRIAIAIIKGLRAYSKRGAPPGTWIAEGKAPPSKVLPASHAALPVANTHAAGGARRHRISRGDTLFSIARRYQVKVENLKTVNGIKDNAIHVGQELLIPVSG